MKSIKRGLAILLTILLIAPTTSVLAEELPSSNPEESIAGDEIADVDKVVPEGGDKAEVTPGNEAAPEAGDKAEVTRGNP